MADRPTGTVSFLFTDIEGSTRLLQSAGETQYSELLATHRAILRASFEAAGGYEDGTEGDAFFVAFSRANDAAQAASRAQRALAEHPWPASIELRVRIGMHTGEPLVGPTGYVGVDVHKVARIMAAGHGGQVLLSEETKKLLSERYALRDLGVHRLKDLLRPERLYQLEIEGLPTSFPPLRTLEGRPTNLPSPVSDFIGRATDVAAIVELLHNERRRLVTLTGVGGGGKTRLALRAAAELVDDYEDGVFHVPLSSLTDPDLVLAEAARVLEIAEEPGRELTTTLTQALAGTEMLLLLDGFDRVRAAAPQVVRLLETCPSLAVLVTSRVPLSVAGETVLPVAPMQPPDAMDLLVSRAQSYGARLERADPALLTIVERVDCLPLGLELAAARLRLLSPAELATKVEEAVFESGRIEHAPTRLKTIRSMIDWSYDLMRPAEQQLFARMSVFGGPASLTALETICDADFETLDGLLNAGFLRRQEGSDGQARFLLPSPVRSYARERLRASGEEHDIARRHATYYLRVARSSLAHGRPADDADEEHRNYRAALAWARLHDPELARQTAGDLSDLLRKRGQVQESRSITADIQALLEPEALADERPRAARGELDTGQSLLSAGEPEEAARHLSHALQVARDAGADALVAEAALYLAYAELERDSHSRALRALVVGLRAVEAAGDGKWAAGYFEGFAAIAAASGEHVHAARMQGAADRYSRSVGPETMVELNAATTSALTDVLGRDGYGQARDAGARLSLNDAASEARAGTAPRQ